MFVFIRDETTKDKSQQRCKKTSLSKLVENQLAKLTGAEEEVEISPLVKSISGVVSENAANRARKGYGSFLKKKYK